MTSQESMHRKHGKTVRANFGSFGRMEMAILGTPCSNIKKVFTEVSGHLAGFRLAYVDADHKSQESDQAPDLLANSQMVYTDKISHHHIDFKGSFDQFRRNIFFNEYDLVLVNGNHFEAAAQIVVVDSKKPLENKLSRITNPVMILYAEGESELPEYLKKHIPDHEELPLIRMEDSEKIASLIRDLLILNVPPLYGLVLSGGMSQRMGTDKGLINYHGKPQREFLFEQLSKFTAKTFMSIRRDQAAEFDGKYQYITDSVDGLGPFGAIISAFREFPNHAWLVAACDLPLLSERSLNDLIMHRNPSKTATSFHNPETDFPEPLITIWEPKAYPVLLQFLALGYSCPRKVLINSATEVIQPADPGELLNANDKEEYEKVLSVINGK